MAAGALTFLLKPGFFPKLQALLDEVFREILGGKEFALDFTSAIRIFRNNLTVAAFNLFAGIVLGLLPLLSTGVNFFILGFLFAVFLISSPAHLGIVAFFLAVVPHGIFEILAFLMSAAFGLRLGWFWFRREEGMSKGKAFLSALNGSLQIFPLVAALLFVAALVEVFVTGNLMIWFLK